MTDQELKPRSLKERFVQFGNVRYDNCPVCESERIENVFQIPFARLRDRSDIKTIAPNGFTVQYLPMYGEKCIIYHYSSCENCESIFLNPQTTGTKKAYRDPKNVGAKRKIDRANLNRKDRAWVGHTNRYKRHIKPNLKKDTRVVVDAGCGGGQYLILLSEDRDLDIERLIGLELSPMAVEHLKDLELEAYQCDLDEPGSLDVLDAESVDFLIFAEIFEHVFYPLRTMKKLVQMLRPGGRLFFTAQRNYPGLPIRAGENQCITDYGLQLLLDNLGCKEVYKFGMKGGRWMVVIEKEAGPAQLPA